MRTNLPDIVPYHVPSWCFNSHIHTIGRSLTSYPRKLDCKHIEIPTPDDDFLALDVINAKNRQPVITLFHGLEGSTNRYYIIELMREFAVRNFSVVAVNFRSCGSKMNRRRRFYHSGETRDMATVFSWINQQFPKSAVAAVGFSLGGNVLLKSLAEKRNSHPVKAAVAVSVPYDLKKGSLNINRGFNKVYEHLFLKSLGNKLTKKRQRFPDLPVFKGSTLYDFDDQITAPIHGFNDAEDYYGTCSSKEFLENIETPTLLIHSRTDPICLIDDMPVNKIMQNEQLDYIITKEGGHVGFWSKPGGWLNKIITNYIHQKID